MPTRPSPLMPAETTLLVYYKHLNWIARSVSGLNKHANESYNDSSKAFNRPGKTNAQKTDDFRKQGVFVILFLKVSLA